MLLISAPKSSTWAVDSVTLESRGGDDFVWKLQSFICILLSLSAWKLVEVTLDNSLLGCTVEY